MHFQRLFAVGGCGGCRAGEMRGGGGRCSGPGGGVARGGVEGQEAGFATAAL